MRRAFFFQDARNIIHKSRNGRHILAFRVQQRSGNKRVMRTICQRVAVKQKKGFHGQNAKYLLNIFCTKIRHFIWACPRPPHAPPFFEGGQGGSAVGLLWVRLSPHSCASLATTFGGPPHPSRTKKDSIGINQRDLRIGVFWRCKIKLSGK